jgi:A/G-specific adenine glycosylase
LRASVSRESVVSTKTSSGLEEVSSGVRLALKTIDFTLATLDRIGVTEKSQKAANDFLGAWPRLRAWYAGGARALPWRKAPIDPYFVWISEVMSQQSTLKTVIPYFSRWMQKFPTLQSLARAPQDEVLKAWAGLGYYSRARNVHATAGALATHLSESGGVWPSRATEWQRFKGVGPYTAAAVASIAFGDRVVPVDGNVLRVGARVFGQPDPLNTSKDRKQIESLFNDVVSKVDASDLPIFGQSLMELGALVCRPGTQALCELCPLSDICVAHQAGRMHEWPLPKRRPLTLEKHLVADVFWDGGTEMLFRKIPAGERLEGQWELPLRQVEPSELEQISSNFSVLGPVTHSITRYRFKAWAVLRGAPGGSPQKGEEWAAWREPDLHLTTLTRKLLLKIDALLN